MRPAPLLELIETSAANNVPVPAAVPSHDALQHDESIALRATLIKAIETVKAAGYRVTKPRKPKGFKSGSDRVGPTIVVRFADDTVTRMSVFTTLEKLDWDRGVRLSQAAWQSRWRTRRRSYRSDTIGPAAPAPPAIVSAHFEQDGIVLARADEGDGR